MQRIDHEYLSESLRGTQNWFSSMGPLRLGCKIYIKERRLIDWYFYQDENTSMT